MVLIQDAAFSVLDGDVALSTHRRTSDKPATRFKHLVDHPSPAPWVLGTWPV